MIEPAANAQALRLDGVSKAYSTVVALEPLSLDVPAGALVALLGPSGCGKSTTLRIVAGLETPDQGRVFLGGRDITQVPANRRRLGLVFQNYALFPHMTVGENVSFGLRMSGVNRAETERRTHEALDLVQLNGLDERYPAMLSGGQQQRVALARTLIMQPAALLLDEPLGALDKNLRESMQFELRRLQRTLGITTILVTHDQEEALTLSDMVVVMNKGRIVQSGAPKDIYDRPDTRFVAAFLGSANIFECLASDDGKSARLATEGGEIVVPIAGAPQPRARILLAVRPERVSLDIAAPPGGTALKGVVRGHVFRGDNHVYEIQVPGLAPVYAQIQHNRMESVDVNDTVYLSWPPESGVVLRDRI
jgi:putative spermidine/putrescine transport system ATP-binding protein